MKTSLILQFQGFLISAGVGVLLAAFYDIFRIFRTVFRSEKRAVFFQDLFFMLCATFATFLVALGVSYGNVRFYILAGEIIGWCLYYLTIGLITIRLFRTVSKFLNKFLIGPIRRLLSNLFKWFFSKVKIIGKKVKNVLTNRKKCLKQHRSIVYNHLITNRKRKGKVRGGKSVS